MPTSARPRTSRATQVWVKKTLDLSFTHQEIVVNAGEASTISAFGQHGIFLTHLLPYALPEPNHANVLTLPYIRHDDFWHYRASYEAALTALIRISGSLLHPVFPLEWAGKADVMQSLREWNVPSDAWWTCERPRVQGTPIKSKKFVIRSTGKLLQCGACKKCVEAGITQDLALSEPDLMKKDDPEAKKVMSKSARRKVVGYTAK